MCSTNHLSAQHHPTCGPDRETTHKKTNHTRVLEEPLSPRISKVMCCSVFSYLNSFPIVMHPCTFSFTFVCSEVPPRSSFSLPVPSQSCVHLCVLYSSDVHVHVTTHAHTWVPSKAVTFNFDSMVCSHLYYYHAPSFLIGPCVLDCTF